MGKIKKLAESVYSRIAAGEVIERPASIVRELLDNSIDAGADEITIQVEDGGIKKIVVIDNGTGMEKDDLLPALSIHSTSKINDINDLLNLSTMGFRGEALHSIQTISKISIFSNADDSGRTSGYSISNFGEDKFQVIPVAQKKGTKIEISDIFYEIPARRKFLKSKTSEWNAVKNIIIAKIFSTNNISFRLFHNKQLVFTINKDYDFRKKFFTIYKNESVFDIHYNQKKINDKITLEIYHSAPDVFFSSRKYQELFVNNRPVTVSFFYASINAGMRNYISPGRFPLIYCYLNIDPGLIDVNIHPAKKEIKFHDQNEIFKCIHILIAESLSKFIERELIKPTNDFQYINNEIIKAKTNNNKPLNDNQLNLYNQEKDYLNEKSTSYYEEVLAKKERYNSEINNNVRIHKSYEIIGVVFDTYIIVEHKRKLLFIDQHAACEAIIFKKKQEKYSKNNDKEKLIVPIIFDIPKWSDNIEKKLELLNKNGFLIEKSEGTTLIIRELPSILLNRKDYDYAISLITDFLDKNSNLDEDANIIDEILIEVSCREAVKKGDKLTVLEMAEIVDEYLKLDIKNCPHGRPSHYELSSDSLEKIFQRKK